MISRATSARAHPAGRYRSPWPTSFCRALPRFSTSSCCCSRSRPLEGVGSPLRRPRRRRCSPVAGVAVAVIEDLDVVLADEVEHGLAIGRRDRHAVPGHEMGRACVANPEAPRRYARGVTVERRGWLVDDDGERAVGVVGFGCDGETESVVPGALGEFCDVSLAAVEAVVVLVGFEEEAFEVAEVVVDEAGDLAGSALVSVSGCLGLVSPVGEGRIWVGSPPNVGTRPASCSR